MALAVEPALGSYSFSVDGSGLLLLPPGGGFRLALLKLTPLPLPYWDGRKADTPPPMPDKRVNDRDVEIILRDIMLVGIIYG